MRAVRLILLRHLRQNSRNSTLLVFALVLPLGLAFLTSMISGAGQAPPKARYGVTGSAEFAAALRPLVDEGVIAELRPVDSAAEGRRLVERGDLAAVFAVSPAAIDVIGDVDAPISVQVARELAETYAAGERAGNSPPAIRLSRDATLGTRELDPGTYRVAGMAVFFLFFVLMFSVIGLFEEHRTGTLARMLAAPIPRHAVLTGALSAGVLTGVAGMTVLVAASTLLLDARWGPPLGVAALVAAVVLAAAGVAAAAASFAGTAEQAGNRVAAAATLLGVLGGAFFPLGDLAGVARLTPHHWFLQGLAEQRGGGSALLATAVLLGFAALTLPVALARTGRLTRA